MDTPRGSRGLYGHSWGVSLEMPFGRLRGPEGGQIWEMHCDAFRRALGASLEMHCGRVRVPVEAPGEDPREQPGTGGSRRGVEGGF